LQNVKFQNLGELCPSVSETHVQYITEITLKTFLKTFIGAEGQHKKYRSNTEKVNEYDRPASDLLKDN